MREKESDKQPLADITVVDITQVVAGPFATMNLGDLGAEVIKVEAIGRGDRSRNIQPVPEYFDSLNRNKQSITVNLKMPQGQQIIHNIIEDADVLVESTKPGRAEAFNIAYKDLAETNPELIYCSISGFGTDSPYENLPAWDMLVQGMSGIMGITGEEGGKPLWSGLPSGDLIAAMYTTQSVLAALYARERGMIDSEWIEVPMLDAAISWLSSRAGHTFGTGESFPRLGTRHPSMAPFGMFNCKKEAIVIAAGTASLWEDFCEVIGREDLLEDDRFRTLDARVENATLLTEIIESELQNDTADRWVERLQAAEIPAGPIHDTRSVWSDEHVKQRELHREIEREDCESADVIDHPIHYSELETHLGSPPERLGQSTTSVLEQYGYDKKKIGQLRESGIIG